MELAELFKFRTEVEEYRDVPWESEATEELLEDIVGRKYEKYKKTYPTMAKELEEKKKQSSKSCERFCEDVLENWWKTKSKGIRIEILRNDRHGLLSR